MKGNSHTPQHRSRPTRRKKSRHCHCCRRARAWHDVWGDEGQRAGGHGHGCGCGDCGIDDNGGKRSECNSEKDRLTFRHFYL